jgi:hypothetical protein
LPVIEIWGLPDLPINIIEEELLKEIRKDVLDAVSGFKILGITKDQIEVFFPPEKTRREPGMKIVIWVKGLFEKPERTCGVLNGLANVVSAAVWKHFPKSRVECFVESFNPARGFRPTA